MNRLPDLIVLLIACNLIKADQTLQCGEWHTYNDEKCFKVYENKLVQNYEDAKNLCYQNEGSSLVSIHSQEEQDHLFNLIYNVHHIVNDVWIGAHYKEKTFNWTDNTAVNYTSWSSGNPRNESGYDCVILRIEEPNHGKWLNEPCDKMNSIVCQKMQNWLFSYLQKTVMDLRDEVKNLTKKLENTVKELENNKEKFNQKLSETTPAGTIAYFGNTIAPTGWLKANGQVVSRTTYGNLFASIGTTFGSGDGSTTFTLPDLRGEFIRGWSDGRDVDTDRNLGSFKWGSSIPYALYIDDKWQVSIANGEYQTRAFAASTFDGGFHVEISANQTRNGMTFNGWNNDFNMYYNDATTRGTIKSWSMLQGTRPRNIALLACIKY